MLRQAWWRSEEHHAVPGLVRDGWRAAPEPYDLRRTSDWFDTPARCMQFLPGRQQDLQTVG